MKKIKEILRRKTLSQNRKVSNLITDISLHAAFTPWPPKACTYPIALCFPPFVIDRWQPCLGTHCFKTHLVQSLLDAFILLWHLGSLNISNDGKFTAVWHRLFWEQWLLNLPSFLWHSPKVLPRELSSDYGLTMDWGNRIMKIVFT